MTDSTAIKGVFPAALTMFTEAGDLDERATARHVEYLIRGGVHGLIAAGTSGEFIAMTEQERLRTIEVIIQAAAGRVPVYAGTGQFSTRLTIAMTEAARRLGAAGVIVSLPYYLRPPKAFVIEHFRALRRETDLPIMLYNNPLFTACAELTPREVAALAEEGVIQSVKCTFESVVPVHDLLHLCGDTLRVFYGSFQSPMEAMLAGAHGWTSGLPNFLPRECVQLYDACAAGDVSEARRIWERLIPFVHLTTHQLLGPATDLAVYRAGLDLMGEHGGHSRLPFQPLTEPQTQQLRQLMLRQGILS